MLSKVFNLKVAGKEWFLKHNNLQFDPIHQNRIWTDQCIKNFLFWNKKILLFVLFFECIWNLSIAIDCCFKKWYSSVLKRDIIDYFREYLQGIEEFEWSRLLNLILIILFFNRLYLIMNKSCCSFWKYKRWMHLDKNL